MGFSSLREILQKGMGLIGESDRVELDRMWKELKSSGDGIGFGACSAS